MNMSRRAKRMQMHHARRKDRNAALNMVSLMDIFTILVFFLLVNATSSEVLPSPKNIVLPDSTAEKMPVKNLVIAVDKDSIRLQGVKVASVKQSLQSKSKTIRPLYTALKKAALTNKDLTDKKGVTIMGDKTIPFRLLRKVMITCTQAGYGRISLAVLQRSRPSG